MGTPVDQAECPKCGRRGLYVNTEDWKPTQIKCPSLKCGWKVDLKQFWPKEDFAKVYKGKLPKSAGPGRA